MMSTAPEEVTITHISPMRLRDFVGSEWRSFDSRFDRHLAGDDVFSPGERRGYDLFYGRAGCSDCHAGGLLTDHKFHALALPPFGPGRTRVNDPYTRDVGRMAETDRLADAYRFRTPSLRNVALTAPYGHNGAYPTLEGIVRHHLDPVAALESWTPSLARLPDVPWLAEIDFVAFEDAREMGRLSARVDIAPVRLSRSEIADLVAFLGTLTGNDSLGGRLGAPAAVPSGLPVDR